MELHFYKYHGTGNDFILVDNRNKDITLTKDRIAFLCHRHFGIGADGLMLLELEDGYDFKMVYFNSDGKESSMCGNGGRCIAAFAKKLGMIGNKTTFLAIDGAHNASFSYENVVSLKMGNVDSINFHNSHAILNTGSPHYIQWTNDIDAIDVVHEGRAVRDSEAFKEEGINVNFVQREEEGITVRTYERGVEDETLSCGTGVTAAAIAASGLNIGSYNTLIKTPGGMLSVSFVKPSKDSAEDVYLIGPAIFVFAGQISL